MREQCMFLIQSLNQILLFSPKETQGVFVFYLGGGGGREKGMGSVPSRVGAS